MVIPRVHATTSVGSESIVAAAESIGVSTRSGADVRLIKVRSEATLDGGESPPPLMAEGEFTLASGGPGEEGA